MNFKELLRLLHSNFPEDRQSGILKVGSFMKQLSARKGLTPKICNKLSEGLFYAMWMQDKALKQEKLASQIGFALCKIEKFEQQMLMMKEFFKILLEKWYNIDKIRIEKFMMLARIILRSGIFFLSKSEWDNLKVKEFHSVLCETIWDEKHTDPSLFYHILDIYLGETQKKAKDLFNQELVSIMIEPFYHMLSRFTKTTMLKHIEKHIFMEDYEDIPRDYDTIKNRLAEIAANPKIKKNNKKVIADIIQKYRDIQNGVYGVVDSDSGTDLDESDIEEAADRLAEEAKRDKLETIEFRKNRKHFKPTQLENVEDINLADFNDDDFY